MSDPSDEHDEIEDEIDEESDNDYSSDSDSDISSEDEEKNETNELNQLKEGEDVSEDEVFSDDDEELEKLKNFQRQKQLKKAKKSKNLHTFTNMFPRITESEFIKIIQKLAKAIEESMIDIPEEYLPEIFGNTGDSEEMAYRMFYSEMPIPFHICRFIQGYEDIFIDCRSLKTKDQMETKDLESDELSFTQRYFLKEFD